MITSENAVSILKNGYFINTSYQFFSKGRKFWKIVDPIKIELSDDTVIEIPRGFETDLSSVPKWLWSVVRPYGDFLLAAVIHDYLYHIQIYSRGKTDREMLFWSTITNDKTFINKIDNYVRYVFVRAFGWIVWKKL
jgi:hypothetical protein